MQERKVTVGRRAHALPDPFFVLATQNPIEQEGTYPLPEAQLDRFMFSLNLDYPAHDEEVEVVRRTTLGDLPQLAPVVTRERNPGRPAARARRAGLRARHRIRRGNGARHPPARGRRPRSWREDYLEWGAGPRASQCLILGAKALALLDGRLAPEAADVREVASAVLQHRVVVNYRATGAGRKAPDIVAELLKSVREKAY